MVGAVAPLRGITTVVTGWQVHLLSWRSGTGPRGRWGGPRPSLGWICGKGGGPAWPPAGVGHGVVLVGARAGRLTSRVARPRWLPALLPHARRVGFVVSEAAALGRPRSARG